MPPTARVKAQHFLQSLRFLIVTIAGALAVYISEIGWRRGLEMAVWALVIWVGCIILEHYLIESVIPAMFGLAVTHSESQSEHACVYIEPKPYKGISFVVYDSAPANAIAPGGGAEIQGIGLQRSEVPTLVLHPPHNGSLEMIEAMYKLKTLRDAAIRKRKAEED